MMQRVSVVLLLFLISTANGLGQGKVEEQAVRKLAQSFCDAFTNHDGHQLAKIMAEDVDFVTVGALWLHGRSDFEKYHTRLLRGRFKNVICTNLQTSVRFLRPDFAVVHWTWTLQGDKNIDGTARKQRFGMMTMIAEQRNGGWQVDAAQNDDGDPGPTPELGTDVTPVVPIPGSNYKP
jgi:uncharacterized protein (TIGR02246 family)